MCVRHRRYQGCGVFKIVKARSVRRCCLQSGVEVVMLLVGITMVLLHVYGQDIVKVLGKRINKRATDLTYRLRVQEADPTKRLPVQQMDPSQHLHAHQPDTLERQPVQQMDHSGHIEVDQPDSLERHPVRQPDHISDNISSAVFILSTIGLTTTLHEGYSSEFRLTGWIASEHSDTDYQCCILYKSGSRSRFIQPEVLRLPYRPAEQEPLPYFAAQVICPAETSVNDVIGVTLQFVGQKCPNNSDAYTKAYVPQVQKSTTSFAVCLKVLFGNVDIEQLHEWIEYHRIIGVNKIFMFTYNITASANELLMKYMQIGFVETSQYDYGWKHEHPRVVGEHSPLYYEDEQVMVGDCLQRMSSHRYLAIFDLDEFLMPRKHDTVPEMMEYIKRKYPDAGGFKLQSYLFLNNLDKTTNTGSEIARYFNRTEALSSLSACYNARAKNIVIPQRMRAEKFHTHAFVPKGGMPIREIDESIASLNHYRPCYEDLKRQCAKPLTTDKSILKYVRTLRKQSWYGAYEHRIDTSQT